MVDKYRLERSQRNIALILCLSSSPTLSFFHFLLLKNMKDHVFSIQILWTSDEKEKRTQVVEVVLAEIFQRVLRNMSCRTIYNMTVNGG